MILTLESSRKLPSSHGENRTHDPTSSSSGSLSSLSYWNSNGEQVRISKSTLDFQDCIGD